MSAEMTSLLLACLLLLALLAVFFHASAELWAADSSLGSRLTVGIVCSALIGMVGLLLFSMAHGVIR